MNVNDGETNLSYYFCELKKLTAIRTTVYILCFYIILLAVMPCADMHFCGSQERAKCSLIQSHNEGGHDNSMDKCSPLCVCNCCMAAVAQIHEIRFDFMDRQLSTDAYSCYIFGVTHHIIMAVLQPPRMA
jgi:hypothetical protein